MNRRDVLKSLTATTVGSAAIGTASGRDRANVGDRTGTNAPDDGLTHDDPPADDEIRIGIWRSDGAPYLSEWADAVANLRALADYFTSIRGWSTVTWEDHYGPDESVTVAEYSAGGLAAALPEAALGPRRINVVVTDYDGWANLGACHYADFFGRRAGRGVLAHQNVTVPQTSGFVRLPLRYVEPNVVHEMLHGLTPYRAHDEHQFGRQTTEQVTEDSPWPWEDERTRTIVKPSCLATGYTNRWQPVDTDDWTDCAGEDWRRAALWNTRPRTAISACTDAAVRLYLGGGVAAADGFSWDREYL